MILFADCNFLLHFAFDDLAYSKFGKVTEVIVAPCIIRELEKLKNFNQERKIHQRAQVVIGLLEPLLMGAGKMKDGTPIRYIDHECDPSLYGLSQGVADDHLIAAALWFREKQGCDVAVVTNDLGLRLKCKSKNLPFFDPVSLFDRIPRRDATSKREDELEQKVKILEKEISALRDTLPSLQVTFSDGSIERHESRIIPLPYNEADFELAKDLLLSNHRQIGFVLPGIPGSREISQSSISSYNSEIGEFIRDTLRYLHVAHTPQGASRWFRLVPIELSLTNIGRVPADDIDVVIEVESKGSIKIHSEFPTLPKPPEEPKNPLREALDSARLLDRHLFRPPEVNVHYSGPDVGDDGRIRYWIRSLKHGDQERLEPFYVEVGEGEKEGLVRLNFTLAIGNHPERHSSFLVMHYVCESQKVDVATFLRVISAMVSESTE